MGTVTVTLHTTKTCIQTHRYPPKLGLHYKDLHKDTQVSAKAGTGFFPQYRKGGGLGLALRETGLAMV